MKTICDWIRRLVWLVPAMQAWAAVPFYDGFDATPAYGPGTNFLTSINGWASGSSNVQVTAGLYDTAPYSVRLMGPEPLSNSVGGASGQIWTDCRAFPVFGDPQALSAHSSASLAGCFTAERFFAVATNGGWLVCSNTVWGGTNGVLLADGQFARITIYQDYAASNCAVFVNSNLVAQDLPFYGSRAAYNAFVAQGSDGTSTSYLDTVSFSNGPPAIPTDLNGDWIPDVQELALYGYAMRTFTVATNAPVYTNLQAALNVARARDILVVRNGTYAGMVNVNHAVGLVTGGVFTLGPLTLSGSGLAITAAVGFACGDIGISNGNSLAVGGNLTCGNITTGTGTALRVTGNLTCGTVSLGSNSVLSVTGTINGSNVTVNGGLVLGTGASITCTNLTLGPGVGLSLLNATVSAGNLAIGTGATLTITNGTLTANGIVLSGSFTLNSNWGNAAAQSAIPFYDGFENYVVGAPLGNYAFNGWGGSDASVAVESNVVAAGTRAVAVPGSTSASNRVDGAGYLKVWTDVWVRPRLGTLPDAAPTNTGTCVVYFDTNGYLNVYNPSLGWDVCASNANRAAVTNTVAATRFVRMTFCQDFNARQSAVFLDGELLRERIPFGVTAPSAYRRMRLENQSDWPIYADEVSVSATPPADLWRDINSNGINDVIEIDRAGTLFAPNGTAFKFR